MSDEFCHKLFKVSQLRKKFISFILSFRIPVERGGEESQKASKAWLVYYRPILNPDPNPECSGEELGSLIRLDNSIIILYYVFKPGLKEKSPPAGRAGIEIKINA
jgi:hypothetical protein